MIRAVYRGYGSGVLVEDDKFKMHAQGAQAAGIKVGLYYFSQAINEREAVEEASAAVAIAKKYGIAVSYPIAIDIEYSNSNRNGRADSLSGAQRTAVARAFCDTIRNAGYTPMIYASKSWFENPSFLDINQLTSYRIWLAHWGVAQTSYNRSRIDIWQYTSDGNVPGISGRVDMNISYMGY
jgi:GH25 family lysozyme M1 (1,4-beta-N-acetylmuramidase)